MIALAGAVLVIVGFVVFRFASTPDLGTFAVGAVLIGAAVLILSLI